jgi:hypothetical protein
LKKQGVSVEPVELCAVESWLGSAHS